MISFERIPQIIQETGHAHIEQVEKNQRKSTFHMPVSEGVLIWQITEVPEWEADVKSKSDGRLIIYATPLHGKMNLRR